MCLWRARFYRVRARTCPKHCTQLLYDISCPPERCITVAIPRLEPMKPRLRCDMRLQDPMRHEFRKPRKPLHRHLSLPLPELQLISPEPETRNPVVETAGPAGNPVTPVSPTSADPGKDVKRLLAIGGWSVDATKVKISTNTRC